MERVPQTLREKDQSIMETFVQMQHYNSTELYRLNLCRIFLQAEFLSEICTPESDSILPEVWQGIRPHDSCSAFLWPKQTRPFEKSWNLWREAIKLAYLGPSLPLNVQLGPWIGARHLSQRKWNSYVSFDSHILYRRRIVGYRLHNPLAGTFRHRRFQNDYFSALPDMSSVTNYVPVSVSATNHSLDLSKLPRPATVYDDTLKMHASNINSFDEHLQTLEDWQQPLLEHLECITDERRLHALLSSDDLLKITLASDGGARDELGSFGWVLAVGHEILWQCKGPTFGSRPGFFRVESYGFISVLLFIHAYCRYFDVHIDPNITHDFYWHSESLLKRISRALHRSWINPSQCLASDFDLESGILDLIKTLHISFQYLHVKSHQDDSMEIHLLPWAAQMNVHADSLATDFLANYAEPSKLVPFIPASQASLTIHGETITRRCASRLRQAANSPRICQHLMARNDWTYATFRSINWEASGKAMNTLENSVKIFIVKFAHDLLPTRRHMRRIKKSATDTCLHYASCRTLEQQGREDNEGKG
jgi:hypothetical protein